MKLDDWPQYPAHILQMEQQGLVTRTFRRLDPERQESIVLAIMDEAVVKGPTSLNIKEVAERAGISVGSLYTYFGNRAGLLAFAVELSMRFMNDDLARFRPILVAMPLRQALKAYLIGGLEWSQAQSGLVQFFARAAYHGDPELGERVVRPIAKTLLDIIRELMIQGVERGEIRDGIDLEATSRVLHALTLAVGDSQLLPYLNRYFQVYGDEVSSEKALEAMVELVVRGIGVE